VPSYYIRMSKTITSYSVEYLYFMDDLTADEPVYQPTTYWAKPKILHAKPKTYRITKLNSYWFKLYGQNQRSYMRNPKHIELPSWIATDSNCIWYQFYGHADLLTGQITIITPTDKTRMDSQQNSNTLDPIDCRSGKDKLPSPINIYSRKCWKEN